MRGWMVPKIVLLAGSLAAPALAQGDVETGRQHVLNWCTGCHVVDQDGHGADVGPALPALLADGRRTSDEIRGWLADPHPPMPKLDLTRQEIEDIVTYLESLTHP